MTDDIAAIVRELKDRQEIFDCLLRYCRGVDRCDREAVRSAYHPDAIDDHGDYVGDVEGFIDWAFDYHTRYQLRTLHSISNHLCELDGDIGRALYRPAGAQRWQMGHRAAYLRDERHRPAA